MTQDEIDSMVEQVRKKYADAPVKEQGMSIDAKETITSTKWSLKDIGDFLRFYDSLIVDLQDYDPE